MEEEILSDMIRDRETQIKMIKRKMEEQSRKMDRVKNDLATIKQTYQTEHVEHTLTLDKLHQTLTKRIQQLREAQGPLDMKRQIQQTSQQTSAQQPMGAQLHMYNEVMKNLSEPSDRDSSYVLRMQAQLCKAMHSMGMLETQLAMLQAMGTEQQKKLKETITNMVEEKSQVELKLMNELIEAGNARREVEDKHKEMITKYTAEKDALVEKLELQQEHEEEKEEGEEEEDDEEEKEELQQILTQGREEIDRLTEQNRLELEKLEELKAKAIAVRGEPFVEELIATIAEDFKEQLDEDEEEED